MLQRSPPQASISQKRKASSFRNSKTTSAFSVADSPSIQSIISANSIQNITLFQQMSSNGPPLQIRDLLQRIARLLSECALTKDSEAHLLQPQLAALTEQLRSQDLAPQNMLTLLLASPAAEARVARALWEGLRAGREERALLREWKQLEQQPRQNYSIVESSLNTLTKEVLENIKLISEELQHLAHNLTVLRDLPDPSSPLPLPPVPLYFLMRMAMDDTRVSFCNDKSELFFRLYILEESTGLVLLKALRVAEQLSQRFCDQATSRRSSVNSAKTKRSALSQSLEVFKRNQLRLELERGDLLVPLSKDLVIQSEYRMDARKAEKGRGKVDTRSTCCFRF